MFKSRIVVVIGAGASAEVGMPLGATLAENISRDLDIRFEFPNRHIGHGDISLYEMVCGPQRQNAREYQEAAWLIRDGVILADSIDDFLERHQHNQFVTRYGKAAIVHSILKAEKESALFFKDESEDSTINFRAIADTWYVKFIKMLARGVPQANANKLFEKITFIDFNYERCFEQFLLHALPPMYGQNKSFADQIFAKARILHPYGSLGPLPTPSSPKGVPFGGAGRRVNPVPIAEQIRTYSEQIEKRDDDFVEARKAIHEAQVIIFLGMYFHQQNMQVLRHNAGSKARRVFATGFGLSEAACSEVRASIATLFSQSEGDALIKSSARLKIEQGKKCSELFDIYAKTLPIV